MSVKPRHFLTLNDCSRDTLERMITRAMEMKKNRACEQTKSVLAGKNLIMLFEKSSTRTRVSFEVAMRELGGHAIFLLSKDTQMGRGEPIEDSARVLSPMCDALLLRTSKHERLMQLADHATVPVINGLTERFHPCQLLADMMTIRECLGDIRGKTVAWIGDGNNVCNSYINAACLLGFDLRIACPEGYKPDASDAPLPGNASDRVSVTDNPKTAVEGANVVVTDVWMSMGQENEREARTKAFRNYRVDRKLMRHAHPDAIFMHCLPAHREEEVTTDVLEGEQSVVWQEAENRMHAQKALLEWLLADKS